MRLILMMIRRRRSWSSVICAFALWILVLALSGCGGENNDDQRPRVVAAFYPLAYVATQVAGEFAVVTDLTTPGVEPHDLDPAPQAIAAIADADLVVLERDFQPAIDEAAEQNADGEVFDVTDAVDLAPAVDDPERLDPHFWLDPLRMASLAEAVAHRLGSLDPKRREDYSANAVALGAQMSQLDEDFRAGLADCARRTVVVSHNAFGYLGKYDLTLESIVGLSPDAEPTPGDLGRLRELIELEGVTTVFSETLVSPDLSETLAREAGVTTGVLDPIEGRSDDTVREDYVSLMRSNLAALREANEC